MSPDRLLRRAARELAETEKKITASEERAAALCAETEANCSDHVLLEKLSAELDGVNAETERLYALWNDQSEALTAAQTAAEER